VTTATSGTALVTGANKGIGKHIARQLAAAGLTVYVGSRDAERGRATAAEIGTGARLLELDVTDAASVAAAASQVGQLDILVNNAGIGDDPRPAPDSDVDGFRRIYDTNVFGVVAVTNAFLPPCAGHRTRASSTSRAAPDRWREAVARTRSSRSTPAVRPRTARPRRQ
jgi:NAD(P)-dependent dehydrogenase (short-subunit alcohol dehydrogenase family)